MNLLRWIVRLITLLFLVLVVGVGLLITPIGAHQVSAWVTARVAQQVPGTEVAIGSLVPLWPLGVEARAVRWGKAGAGAGAAPILTSDWVLIHLDPAELVHGTLDWSAEGQVNRLDLAALGQVVGQGDLGMQGVMAGPVKAAGVGPQISRLDLKLQALPPGGSIKSSLFKNLISGKLAQALEGQKVVHFTTGKVELVTEENQYRLTAFFDGDHLLDFTIYFPRNGLKLLWGLLKGGHQE